MPLLVLGVESSVEYQTSQSAPLKIMDSLIISDYETGSDNNGGDNEELPKRRAESDQFELDRGQVRKVALAIA